MCRALVGALAFSAAVFLLVGLTNKQSGDWTDFSVGGFILIAVLLTPLFIFIESRAREPIVPPELFRVRNFSVTIAAVFLSAIAFFGAIVFLPRWFQFVQEVSPTASGLYVLPLTFGVIISSVSSGIIVSKTGRYKWLLVGSLVLLAIGLYQLTDTRIPDHAVVSQTVEASRLLRRPKLAGLLNAVMRRFLREDIASTVPGNDEALHDHPQWLIDAIGRDWPGH